MVKLIIKNTFLAMIHLQYNRIKRVRVIAQQTRKIVKIQRIDLVRDLHKNLIKVAVLLAILIDSLKDRGNHYHQVQCQIMQIMPHKLFSKLLWIMITENQNHFYKAMGQQSMLLTYRNLDSTQFQLLQLSKIIHNASKQFISMVVNITSHWAKINCLYRNHYKYGQIRLQMRNLLPFILQHIMEILN